MKTTTWNNFKMESFSLDAHDKTDIPIIILYPNEEKIKHPAVLLLHGITSSKEREWLKIDNFTNGGNLTLSLLKNGFLVAAIDARMHGKRANKDYSNFQSHFNEVLANWNSMHDNTYKDVISTINYLKEREDIEKQNIGIMGYSMGTSFTFKFAAQYPEDIKTIIAAVPPVSKTETGSRSIPLFTKDIKLPVLMLVANNDVFTPLENSKWIYEMIPAKVKDMIVYKSTHSLPVEYTVQTVNWFNKYLK